MHQSLLSVGGSEKGHVVSEVRIPLAKHPWSKKLHAAARICQVQYQVQQGHRHRCLDIKQCKKHQGMLRDISQCYSGHILQLQGDEPVVINIFCEIN